MKRLAPLLVALIAVVLWGGLIIRDLRLQLENASLRTKIADLTAANDRQSGAMKAQMVNYNALRADVAKVANRSSVVASQSAKKLVSDRNNLRTDPVSAQIMHKQQIRNINRQYGPELAKLDLTADQLDKLKGLMIEQNEVITDAQDASMNSGLTAEETQQVISQARNAVEDEIKSLLGPDGYGNFQSAASKGTARMIIQNQFGDDLIGAGVPLNSEQLSALAEIYMNSRNPAMTPDLANIAWAPPDPATGLTPLNQVLLEKAARVLSPAQLPILRQSLIDQNEQQAFNRKLTAQAQRNN